MDARLTPNLVPLLDVLFVLLLFLMLGADFQGREQEPMRIPGAVSINECHGCWSGFPRTLTINVHHRDDRTCPAHVRGRRCEEEGHWTVSILGNECLDPKRLATLIVREAMRRGTNGHPRSDMRILLRSDENAPCGLAQQAMDVCTRMGFYRFAIAARRPPH